MTVLFRRRKWGEKSTSISLAGNTERIYRLAKTQKISSDERLWSDPPNLLKFYKRKYGAKRIISDLKYCKGRSISYRFYLT